MGFFRWLDKYDSLMWSIFKFLLLIAAIIFAAHLERENDKEMIKEAIQEINKNK